MELLAIAVFIYIHYGLPVLFSNVFIQAECPPERKLKPCTCSETGDGIMCEDIRNLDKLRNVIRRNKKSKIEEVFISGSTIMYVPNEIFDNLDIRNFTVMHSQMATLFDKPPKSSKLESVKSFELDTVKFERIFDWKLLKHMTDIRKMVINKTDFKEIGERFRKYVSKKLRVLSFTFTGLRYIKPGALDHFRELTRVILDGNEITDLKRNFFPRPANKLLTISVNFNKISHIREDLFHDMPILQKVAMTKNNIKTIPETAFRGLLPEDMILDFDGNPLRCNCTMLWIVELKRNIGKRYRLEGNCKTPIHMSKKNLVNLAKSDFSCIEVEH